MCRPTWSGTARPVSRPGEQARKIFAFDSIADEMAVEQAVHPTEFGGIGIIINNAGTVAPDDSVSARQWLVENGKSPRELRQASQ
jgi:hypothetical protein